MDLNKFNVTTLRDIAKYINNELKFKYVSKKTKKDLLDEFKKKGIMINEHHDVFIKPPLNIHEFFYDLDIKKESKENSKFLKKQEKQEKKTLADYEKLKDLIFNNPRQIFKKKELNKILKEPKNKKGKGKEEDIKNYEDEYAELMIRQKEIYNEYQKIIKEYHELDAAREAQTNAMKAREAQLVREGKRNNESQKKSEEIRENLIKPMNKLKNKMEILANKYENLKMEIHDVLTKLYDLTKDKKYWDLIKKIESSKRNKEEHEEEDKDFPFPSLPDFSLLSILAALI